MSQDATPIVLLVEDDMDVREAVADTLEEVGYRVLTARHGLEALGMLRDGGPRPCLILLDLMMPVMDGWQFRTEQCKCPELAQIPVVALSAHAGMRDLDVVDHLRKPIQLRVLMRVVERFCGAPRPVE
jgi:CheY-like chemotaxis protein